MNASIPLFAAGVTLVAALTSLKPEPAAAGFSPVATAAEAATGEGAYRFESVSNWGAMPGPDRVPTHGGVARDKAGNVYCSTDTAKGILVYNPDGSFKNSIGGEFSRIHSLTIREEKGEEFLYAAWLGGAQALKLKTDGTPVLKIETPKESGKYDGSKPWQPTAVDATPDGTIFVADGYSTSYVHKFDASGKYLMTFGGKGKDDNTFETCHGMAVDNRGEKPLLLICDRENRRLQQFDLDGKFVKTIATNLRRPAAVAVENGHIAVAELEARVTLFDASDKEVAHLGDNPDRTQWANFNVDPPQWNALIFTAPHGVCWDGKGGVYVQDWNRNGRLRFLKPVK